MSDQLFEDAEPARAAEDHDVFYDGPPSDDAPGEASDDAPGPGSSAPGSSAPGSSAEVLVEALFQAGPEAAEHLLKAAQELLLAAKAVVDAGERVVEQHRGAVEADPEQPRVRRIDLA